MPSILQISDTHLSPRNGLFLDNLAALRRLAEQRRPDLTVFSGDLSLDGADREADMRFAAAQLRAFPGRLVFLPGNHDIGSHPASMPHQPVDAERLARFRRHFGADRHVLDLPGWRVVALDTEIMDSGLAEEAAQAAFLREAAASAGGRRIALFLHKPLSVSAPQARAPDPWSVPPAAHGTLAPLLEHPALRLVASGHLHLFARRRRGAAALVWAPAASFVIPPEEQDNIAGERCCGALLHHLGSDGVETEFLALEGMTTRWIGAIRHLTYPRSPP